MESTQRTVALAAAVVVVDGAAKLLGRAWLSTNGVQLFPGVTLRIFENARGPFGLGPLWLALLASIVVFVLFARRRVQRSTLHAQLSQVGLGLVVGGGFSNLAERLLFGRTTDLLVLGGLTAFNAADVAIALGLAVLLLPPPRRSLTTP